jgi:hypothetical protein
MIKLFKLVILLFIFSIISCNKETKKANTIQFMESPAMANSMQPFLFAQGDDLMMSWTQKINDSVNSLNYSTLSDGKWTNAKEIASGNDWIVNWADFPAIAKNKENILVHYLQRSDPVKFSYDIQTIQSSNNGKSWNQENRLHKDTTITEHGFVTMLPYENDSFFITWLDGRNTGGGEHNGGAMNIRTATILANGDIVDDTLVDGKTCDCCQTSAAITPNGPIIVYRNRTDDEVRDIYISRLVDDKWTEPKSIHNDNWEIKGCPVNGPRAATFKNTLVIAWFTAANKIPKVNLTFSNDNGENFAVPIQIDNGKPIGRVDVALLDDQNALVSWVESTEEEAEIKIVKVNRDGTKSIPVVVSPISASRASGFPQFELINNNAIFAWNNIEDKKSTVKIAQLSLEMLN